jgi:hypothetical protein
MTTGHAHAPQPPSLAQLYFSWDELDALADLVDDRITNAQGADWGLFNSLRTALREAQFGIERLRPEADGGPRR